MTVDWESEEPQAYVPQPDLTDNQVVAMTKRLEVHTRDMQRVSKYPQYFKDVSDISAIDLYQIAKLYEINDPALFHAFKKIVCAGKRGAKDQAQDVQEAIDALARWQELNNEN